jgi:hypothetical protein
VIAVRKVLEKQADVISKILSIINQTTVDFKIFQVLIPH